jgi:hypothetical protein
MPFKPAKIEAAVDVSEDWAQEYECQFMNVQAVVLPYELLASCERLKHPRKRQNKHAGTDRSLSPNERGVRPTRGRAKGQPQPVPMKRCRDGGANSLKFPAFRVILLTVHPPRSKGWVIL